MVVFYRATLCIVLVHRLVLAVGRCLSVCPSVCLSVRHTRFVTLVYCSQTAKDIIKLFSAA